MVVTGRQPKPACTYRFPMASHLSAASPGAISRHAPLTTALTSLPLRIATLTAPPAHSKQNRQPLR